MRRNALEKIASGIGLTFVLYFALRKKKKNAFFMSNFGRDKNDSRWIGKFEHHSEPRNYRILTSAPGRPRRKAKNFNF